MNNVYKLAHFEPQHTIAVKLVTSYKEHVCNLTHSKGKLMWVLIFSLTLPPSYLNLASKQTNSQYWCDSQQNTQCHHTSWSVVSIQVVNAILTGFSQHLWVVCTEDNTWSSDPTVKWTCQLLFVYLTNHLSSPDNLSFKLNNFKQSCMNKLMNNLIKMIKMCFFVYYNQWNY